ncbi:hypothetical protein C8R43DRAFT_1236755 [Mycena crocata]|nr:hypothetical protein C8R43DRAFT_1236755 [Mycena crocata]
MSYIFTRRKANLLQEGQPPTLPQELIDSILDLIRDKRTLKSCSRVARSFRQTSQKHIFADIKLSPAPPRYWRKNALTLQEFSQILTSSPHLALAVRTIVLVEGSGFGEPPWMQRGNFPAILAMLVNLTAIAMECRTRIEWSRLPSTLVGALENAVALPTLSFVRLSNVRFDRGTELLSLLHCCRHVDSLILSKISVEEHGNTMDARPGLSSLVLDPVSVPLLRSVTSALDLRNLQHLSTTIPSPEMEAEIQPILDTMQTLVHCHVKLSHHHSTSIIDLHNLSHLRTLEISISFLFDTSPDDYNPVGWAGNILGTTQVIQHVVLNVFIEERDLDYLHCLGDLEPLLLAPLRNLTVNLDSVDLDFAISGGERQVCEAFPTLCDREMLKVELLGMT